MNPHIKKALGLLKWVPDKLYLQMYFFAKFKRFIDWENPKTFNEKLQWLKIYNRDPAYINLVDKYEVKQYVAEKIGEEYLIPTLGIWDRFEDIDFDALPDRFVLKCTHDSGGLVICKDKSKLDKEAAKKKINKSLKSNYYYIGREWPYKGVKPRILAEAYMEDTQVSELRDYKFFCFNGEAKIMYLASERYKANDVVKFDFYDMDFNHLDFRNGHPNNKVPAQKPETFEKMRELAEKLAQGFRHVRVDLYEVNGKNYFGEMTFYNQNGFVPFDPEEWDYKIGEWLDLPDK